MLPRTSSHPSMGRRRSRSSNTLNRSHDRSLSVAQTGSAGAAALIADEAKDTEHAREQGWATIDEHRRETARAEGYAELARREQRYHQDVHRVADEQQMSRVMSESAYQQQMEDYNRRVRQQQSEVGYM